MCGNVYIFTHIYVIYDITVFYKIVIIEVKLTCNIYVLVSGIQNIDLTSFSMLMTVSVVPIYHHTMLL